MLKMNRPFYYQDLGAFERRPHSLLRHGNYVYVVFQDQERPALVKFNLKVAGIESEVTSPDISDRE